MFWECFNWDSIAPGLSGQGAYCHNRNNGNFTHCTICRYHHEEDIGNNHGGDHSGGCGRGHTNLEIYYYYYYVNFKRSCKVKGEIGVGALSFVPMVGFLYAKILEVENNALE